MSLQVPERTGARQSAPERAEHEENQNLEEYVESVNRHGVGCAEHTCGNPRLLMYVLEEGVEAGLPLPDLMGLRRAFEAAMAVNIPGAATAAADRSRRDRSRSRRSAATGAATAGAATAAATAAAASAAAAEAAAAAAAAVAADPNHALDARRPKERDDGWESAAADTADAHRSVAAAWSPSSLEWLKHRGDVS